MASLAFYNPDKIPETVFEDNIKPSVIGENLIHPKLFNKHKNLYKNLIDGYVEANKNAKNLERYLNKIANDVQNSASNLDKYFKQEQISKGIISLFMPDPEVPEISSSDKGKVASKKGKTFEDLFSIAVGGTVEGGITATSDIYLPTREALEKYLTQNAPSDHIIDNIGNLSISGLAKEFGAKIKPQIKDGQIISYRIYETPLRQGKSDVIIETQNNVPERLQKILQNKTRISLKNYSDLSNIHLGSSTLYRQVSSVMRYLNPLTPKYEINKVIDLMHQPDFSHHAQHITGIYELAGPGLKVAGEQVSAVDYLVARDPTGHFRVESTKYLIAALLGVAKNAPMRFKFSNGSVSINLLNIKT